MSKQLEEKNKKVIGKILVYNKPGEKKKYIKLFFLDLLFSPLDDGMIPFLVEQGEQMLDYIKKNLCYNNGLDPEYLQLEDVLGECICIDMN